MKRKIRVLIMAIMCSMSAFVGGMFSQKAEAANLNEVPEGYTAIRTIEDLRGINNAPSGKYILMNDIDLTEATKKGGSYDTGNGWTPLNLFKGVLDGNGCRIKGMHIYGDNLSYVGLFSEMERATVKNLGITDCDIDVEAGCIGAIAGSIGNWVEIQSCFVTGTINANSDEVGSLIGRYHWYDNSVSDCYSNVQLTTQGRYECAIANTWNLSDRCYFAGSSINPECEFRGYSSYYLIGSLIDSSNVTADPLTQAQMRSKTSFTGWDFDETWFIDPYSYYQYPQLKSVPQTRVSGIEMISLPTKTTYAQGEDISLDGAVAKLIYEDGNTATVSVNNDFKVEYDKLKIGQQNVKLSYLDGSVTFPVTFTGIEVNDIEISASATNIAFGNTIEFTAVVKPEQALDNKLTWSLKDENGKEVEKEDATITQKGVFLGKKLGKYIVTVSTNNGVSKSYTVTVTKPMVYLIADPEELTMNSGDSITIGLKQSPLDSTEDIIWKSSNKKIATVENGVVTAHMPGRVVITAKTESCEEAKCVVTVIQDILQCDVSGLINQTYTGKEIILKDLKVYSEEGLLRKGVDYTVEYEDNVDIGTATVIITGCGKYSGTISRTFDIVRGDLKNVKISSSAIMLKVKETKKLNITGAAGYPIKWSSKSKKIATVDKNGKVTAKKAGKTYITAKVGSSTFKCKVTVYK